MALESEPVIAELSALEPPKVSHKSHRSKVPQTAKKDKVTVRRTRSKDKSTQRIREVATGSKRLIAPTPARPKKARTTPTISARRKSLSISPLKRRMPLIEDQIDSPTDDQDPTLNENGIPARLAPNILPGEQSTAFAGDENYPLGSNISAKLRSLERDISRTILGRGDFAQFEDQDTICTARLFWQCGLDSTDELKKTRHLGRSFTLEDLRKDGASAKDLNLFTGLFHLFPPHPLRLSRVRRAISPNVAFLAYCRNFPLTFPL